MDSILTMLPYVMGVLDTGTSMAHLCSYAMQAIPCPHTLFAPFFLALLAVVCYYSYVLFCRPLNRVRSLSDVGYVVEGKMSRRDACRSVKKRRQAGDVPPVYPNGWFAIAESRMLTAGEVKSVSALGMNLAVFRAHTGDVHVMDAYCPHMGANLACGGRVVDSTLECPFHGWRFSGKDGRCVGVPYSDTANIPAIAKVKVYTTMEVNGFVYMWHHAEGVEPYWSPPVMDKIETGEWTWMGRSEHTINAHIQEIPENGADAAHMSQVHSAGLPSGVDLRNFYGFLGRIARHLWTACWNPDEEQGHVACLQLEHAFKLFGWKLSLFDMDVSAKQIGPGIVYLEFRTCFGRGAFLQALTPVEPLVQKIVHHIYFDRHVPMIIAKGFLLGEALMVERDLMIWNNKRFVKKPLLVKSKEDKNIARFRRWYEQFYTENSPQYTTMKASMDW